MAKIIYGVAGQGFGHSSRSHLIGQYLIDQGHDVIFAASNQSLSYLSKYFPGKVKPIAGLHFVYDQGALSPLKTIKSNVLYYRNQHSKNLELFQNTFEPFEPDFVITDFEPFSAWWAFLNKIPYISIDHEHFLTMCKLEHNPNDLVSRITSNFVTHFYYAGAAEYLILNFFKTGVRHKRATVVPPVVRRQITQTPASDKGHILLYSTDCSNLDKLIRIFNSFGDKKFIIYGFDKELVSKNCILKKTQTDNFINDLASCNAVIATAGFSLISECLHFGKKMLVMPVLGQYEQMINANYIQKLGIGLYANKLDADILSCFFDFINSDADISSDLIYPDNQKFFNCLENSIDNLSKQPILA